MDFSGKVVLVTGGAAGLGQGIAQAFGRAGAAVFIVDIDPAGESLAHALRADGHDILFHRADVTSAAACEAMIETCLRWAGKLDIAVNNVGVVDADHDPGQITTVAAWDRTLSLSLSSTFYCLRPELSAMMTQGGGVIVNLASVASYVSLPGRICYTSAKHGIIGLTKAVCDGYAAQNIRCNAIAPGIIATPGLRAAQTGGRSSSVAAIASRIPMGRLGAIEEIAGAALWLSSDEAAYVNGTCLTVDGGYLAR